MKFLFEITSCMQGDNVMKKKRSLLPILIILVTSISGFTTYAFGAETTGLKSQPNIVIILSDDHRWDYMSNLGHPYIKTPNLDRLSDEGVTFSNAFCTTSLCSPSRASFLTGQFARTHGVQNNMTAWNNQNITFLELLKKAGYRTAFIGKWHMPGSIPQLRGVDLFVTFEVVGGQGIYFDCPLIVNGENRPSKKHYITEELTDYAIEFMDDHKNGPFCIYLSHKAVHAPFTPSPEFAHRYDSKDVPLPPEADSWVGMTRGNFTSLQFSPLESTMRDYCETLAAMDQEIGRVLKKLDVLGIAQNTMVVYASDNGYFWGEHQLVDKRWAYEESIRIPFIVRYPTLVETPGRKTKQMVLNIDLAPSLLALAGAPVPDHMEGKSFMPILMSETAQGRNAWHYEYFKDFFYKIPKIDAVRTETHKYITYGNKKDPELFNLMKDPKEHYNIIDTEEGKRLLPYMKKMLEEQKK